MNLDNTKIPHPFVAPDSYFKNLEENLLSEIKLPAISKNAGFETPQNYFDDLEGQILISKNLDQLKSKDQPKVPDGFFDSLENNIISQIKLEKISKEEAFTVSGNYFDHLEKEIISKTINKEAKILNFNSKQWRYFRNAAAIIIISVLSFGIFKSNLLSKDHFDNLTNEEMIAYLETQDIEEIDLENVGIDSQIDEIKESVNSIDISEQEIENYLKQIEI